jgi:hypothetical protein
MIAPANDVWGWLPPDTRYFQTPWAVSLMFEYTPNEEGLVTIMTVTAEPVPSSTQFHDLMSED